MYVHILCISKHNYLYLYVYSRKHFERPYFSTRRVALKRGGLLSGVKYVHFASHCLYLTSKDGLQNEVPL